MTDPTHAHRLLAARKWDPSPANIARANRRVFAAGRLAELGGHMVPGLLRVEAIEHGDADAMTAGSMIAECWLDARDDTEWSKRAQDLLILEQIAADMHGLRLVIAVHRASRWDRWRERLAWAVSR